MSDNQPAKPAPCKGYHQSCKQCNPQDQPANQNSDWLDELFENDDSWKSENSRLFDPEILKPLLRAKIDEAVLAGQLLEMQAIDNQMWGLTVHESVTEYVHGRLAELTKLKNGDKGNE